MLHFDGYLQEAHLLFFLSSQIVRPPKPPVSSSSFPSRPDGTSTESQPSKPSRLQAALSKVNTGIQDSNGGEVGTRANIGGGDSGGASAEQQRREERDDLVFAKPGALQVKVAGGHERRYPAHQVI